MNFDELYHEILKMDKSIRYVVILSKTGEKIYGGYKKGISPLLNDEELKMVHFYARQRWDTRKNLTHKIGKNKYAVAEYEKLKRMSFPIDEKHLLMVTTEINSDHQKIINTILDLISKYSI